MQSKYCRACSKTKSVLDFHARSGTKSGITAHCKLCNNARNSARNKEKRASEPAWRDDRNRASNEYSRARRKERKTYVLEYLRSHPCCDCGEGDYVVLEFDHVRGEKQHNVSFVVNNSGSSLEEIQTEIDKCDVVCANCHRRRTAERGAWYDYLETS